MAPKVSLAISVYNREQYLAEAIKSVVDQTFRDFELVVWDDGSSDCSFKVAEDMASQDDRIRVFRSDHQGVAKCLQAALDQTSGLYLGWIDSDDKLAPTALEETVQALDVAPSVGAVYTDYLIMAEDGSLGPLGSRCKIPYSKNRLLIDLMTFQFRLLRRTAFDRAGGIHPVPYAEDYDLCLRLSEITKFIKVPKPLYYYRLHSNSLSATARIEQIKGSCEAINIALKRRGLSDRYELHAEIVACFHLRPTCATKPYESGSLPPPEVDSTRGKSR